MERSSGCFFSVGPRPPLWGLDYPSYYRMAKGSPHHRADAKVENLELGEVRHEDQVGGLQVPVDDAWLAVVHKVDPAQKVTGPPASHVPRGSYHAVQ